MDGGKTVWAPHPEEGYQLGIIVDVGSSTLSVEPLTTPGQVVVATYDNVYPAVEGGSDVDDNCSLLYLNEATLLHNLRVRYQRNQIYTYVANILLAVNPYQELPIYTPDVIRKYNGKSLGVLPPHVFAIADKAYREMRSLKLSQSIIVSGESGAGKTESTKYILRYLTESYGTTAGLIEQRIVEANPLLESFGNARTMRNNNSSRFGKFVEIHFDEKFAVVGGNISHYLLERSRICSQSAQERNYHVFYRMLAGAPASMKQGLGLDSAASFQYLNPASVKDPSSHDAEEFKHLDHSMNCVGLSAQEKADLFRVVAAVLHLGNVNFEEETSNKKGGSVVAANSKLSLQGTANLLGIEPEELQRSLTSRVMTTTKGGTVGTIINVPLKPDQACNARDALAKAIYVRLFDYIVSRVNRCFPFKSSTYFIGVLDIAGFEYFQINSFEQFCINYCNEKLQQFFNSRILKEEQDLYNKERLGITEVRFVDNQDCIDLIEARQSGVIDILDEECKLPKATAEHFAETVHRTHENHFRLSIPRKSKLVYYRNLRDNEGFVIRHFAGAVCYQTNAFLDKNNDALHASLEQLIGVSGDPFIKTLFPEASTGNPSNVNTKKLALISVGSKFRSQLSELMNKLKSTGSSFIRCLKPNLRMESSQFVGGQILSQLQSAGMVSVLELMQGGYPSRAQFSDLYHMYKAYLPAKLAKLDPRTFCAALFRAVGMNTNDFRFGISKVFFRPGKFAEFDQIMRSDPESVAVLVQRVYHWIVRKQWKKCIYGAVCVQKLARKIRYRADSATKIQKQVRMYLALHKHRPRYRTVRALKALQDRAQILAALASTLKKDKDHLQRRLTDLKDSASVQIEKIKASVIPEAEMKTTYASLSKAMEDFLLELKSRHEQQRVEEEEAARMKKLREEQEKERIRREEEAAKLRKIQEELEAERKRKEEEEKKRIQEEEERRIRAEMEEQRRREEEEQMKRREEERKRREQEEADQLIAKKLQEEEEKALAQRRAAEEQERRDFELAARLAATEKQPQMVIAENMKPSSQSLIAEQSLKRSQSYLMKRQESTTAKKYDLTKWKFADLRDTINTSCDVELLEACRDEFHRRLKVYHAWKGKNKKTTAENPSQGEQRVPQEIAELAAQLPAAPPPVPPRTSSSPQPPEVKAEEAPQRYFRVPFVRPSDRDRLDRQKGWWYAHFDGQWVVRQLELHPNRQPVVLVAGRNDIELCELSLEETGLARKKGAEILEHEFEEAWSKAGGQPYVKTVVSGKRKS